MSCRNGSRKHSYRPEFGPIPFVPCQRTVILSTTLIEPTSLTNRKMFDITTEIADKQCSTYDAGTFSPVRSGQTLTMGIAMTSRMSQTMPGAPSRSGQVRSLTMGIAMTSRMTQTMPGAPVQSLKKPARMPPTMPPMSNRVDRFADSDGL